MVEPSDQLQQIFDKAVEDCKKLGHEYITLEHLTFAMFCEEKFFDLIDNYGADVVYIKSSLEQYLKNNLSDITVDPIPVGFKPKKTQTVERVLNRAFTQVLFNGRPSIEITDVFLSLLNEKRSQAVYFISKGGIDKDKFSEFLNSENDYRELSEDEAVADGQAEKALRSFTTNLNDAVKKGKIDPVIGREYELEQVAIALGRRTKNNAMLVGDPGVGKTAIAEGLAFNIINGNVPEFLKDYTVYNLDISSMLAGSKYRGDFEDRFKLVLKALNQRGKTVLFIDEAHMISGAGAGGQNNANDLANMMKPALSKGNIKVVASTTWEEFRKFFEKDRALMRRFQRVVVDEPTPEMSISILKGVKKYYEKHHNAVITDEAIEAAVNLSVKYLSDRKLPDKAIDLIDVACSRFNISSTKEKIVNVENIQYEVAKLAKLSEESVKEKESENLSNLERNLKSKVYGQDDAVDEVVDKIHVAQAGLKSENKPIGSFVFMGPTGCGKAQPLYSKIKKPSGWTTMGDIQLGETVSTPTGEVAKVINIYDRGTKPVYRLTFADNRVVDCCDEHLWKVYNKHWHKKWQVKSLNEIMSLTSLNTSGIYIPLLSTRDNAAVDLPIDPYTVGAVLGDGSFGNTLSFTSVDPEIVQRISDSLFENYTIQKNGDISYYVNCNDNSGQKMKGIYNNRYRSLAIELGLYKKTSADKFIPDIYKTGSQLQIIQLLQGLLDTDGYVSKGGSLYYTTVSSQLASDVAELVRSIGGIATIRKSTNRSYLYNGNRIPCKDAYTVSIRYNTPSELVSLTRKKERCATYQYADLKLRIKKIEYIDKMPVRCIEIDHPDHLYITDEHVVTHNTELANQLSIQLGIPLIRFDMSEYQEKHAVSKLIGSPPGYVGFEDNAGLLITKIQENPYCVLLLDEIEKSHPDVSTILLQLMDNGFVTGSNGKTADCRNVILIMTTNLGAQAAEKRAIGFGSQENSHNDGELKKFFSPEFRNRLDGIITFNKLSKETMIKVVGKFLLDLKNLTKNKNIHITITDEAIDWLIDKGFDKVMGARPLQRVIDKDIKRPLSKLMLFGSLKNGGNVKIDVNHNEIIILDQVNEENCVAV